MKDESNALMARLFKSGDRVAWAGDGALGTVTFVSFTGNVSVDWDDDGSGVKGAGTYSGSDLANLNRLDPDEAARRAKTRRAVQRARGE